MLLSNIKIFTQSFVVQLPNLMINGIFNLRRVTEHSAENKMTSQNLSTVFAPSIMPPPDFDKIGDSIPDLCNEIAALQLLIQHNKMIFN